MKARMRQRWTLKTATLVGTLTVAATLSVPGTAEAKPMRGDKRVGLGGGVGDPFGPSLKIFLHPQHALQFDLGWAPMHHGHGITHVNYLFHFNPFVGNSVMDFGLYLGVGAGVAFWSGRRYCADYYYDDGPGPNRGRCYDYWYGHRGYDGGPGAAAIVRAPVGLYFHWQKVPIDTVVEGGWSPYVFPWDPWHGDFSVKVRYYF